MKGFKTRQANGDKLSSGGAANFSDEEEAAGWVQCEICDKWRRLAHGVLEWNCTFVCRSNKWSDFNDCSVAEEQVSSDEEYDSDHEWLQRMPSAGDSIWYVFKQQGKVFGQVARQRTRKSFDVVFDNGAVLTVKVEKQERADIW